MLLRIRGSKLRIGDGLGIGGQNRSSNCDRVKLARSSWEPRSERVATLEGLHEGALIWQGFEVRRPEPERVFELRGLQTDSESKWEYLRRAWEGLQTGRAINWRDFKARGPKVERSSNKEVFKLRGFRIERVSMWEAPELRGLRTERTSNWEAFELRGLRTESASNWEGHFPELIDVGGNFGFS